MKRCASILLLLGLVASSGCEFHARDADSYRKATRALLATRNADIKTCYDTELRANPQLAGTVVIKFTVKKESGALSNVKLDEGKSTAPASLGQCVVKAIDGLALDPPDARDGKASFEWEFQLKQT